MELLIACDNYKTLFISVCELRARDEFVVMCIVLIIYLLLIYTIGSMCVGFCLGSKTSFKFK